MRKKIPALFLALALSLSLIPTALAAPAGIAKASTQSVEVDGTPVEFQMYALEEAGGLTNYVKLRDVAHVLNGTSAQFSVGYDGTISIVTGETYTGNGSEMTTPYSGDRAYEPGPGAVKVNGAGVSLEAIVLKDDAGGAYTYFKLRDLGAALGFKVDWTGERGVFIETGAGTAPAPAAPADPSDLTLADFEGIWLYSGEGERKHVNSSIAAEELIISGGEYELYRRYESSSYYCTRGTIVLQKDVHSSLVGDMPYMFDFYSNVRYSTGKLTPLQKEYGTFPVMEVDLAAGYFIDRNGGIFRRADAPAVKPLALADIKQRTGKDDFAVPEPAAVGNAEDYAYQALDYIHSHLKFPSTMKVLEVRAGSYDRIKNYEGAPEMMKPSGAILSLTDQYYVVTMKIEAANSFGAMVTDTYVSLFNLTDGKTYHDLENYASTWADDAWGQKKLDWMNVESEALLIGAMVSFPELSRESVDRIVSQIKG